MRIRPAVIAAVLLTALGVFLLRGKDRDMMAGYTPAPEPVALNEILTNSLSELPELKGMDAVIDSFMRAWSIKGISLSVMRNDSLLFSRGYGWADKEKGQPMTPGTTLRMASVSKLITAVGIMKMQEEGLLNIQSPVFGPFGILNEYDRFIRDDRYFEMTVEHLLRHQAGFSTDGGDPMFSTPAVMRRYGLAKAPDTQTLVRKLVSEPLAFDPGTFQQYSNFGYLLLSLVIEKISGMSYEDYMQAYVLNPAGCYGFHIANNYLSERYPDETRYYMQPDAEPVREFNGSGRTVIRCYGGNDIHALSGAGAWVGSTPELARLIAVIDSDPALEDILDPFTIEQMTTRLDDDTYPLGWVDCSLEGEWTRTGSFSGTSALVKRFPDGECWILITNTSTWRGSHFSRNTSELVRSLRPRYSASLPKRNLFYSPYNT